MPSESIITNFTTENIDSHAFSTIFSVTGILHSTQGNLVTKNMYRDGSFLIAYDLSPELNSSNSECVAINNQGTIRLAARFENPLKSSITILIYMLFDSVLHIDHRRNISIDYN